MTKTDMLEILKELPEDALILLWNNETGYATRLKAMSIIRGDHDLFLYDSGEPRVYDASGLTD